MNGLPGKEYSHWKSWEKLLKKCKIYFKSFNACSWVGIIGFFPSLVYFFTLIPKMDKKLFLLLK